MLLFVDTETTGLPKKSSQNAEVEPGIWPDIVSIAWILTSDDGQIIDSWYSIVKPDGWVIPENSTRVHGITHEHAVQYGMDLQSVLSMMPRSGYCLVSHNINFDKNVIINALKWRLGENVSSVFNHTFCTMKTNLKRGRNQKLADVYAQYFGEPPKLELHNALNDATICMKIYFKMNLPPSHDIPTSINNNDSPKVSAQTLSVCITEA